ncbi:MAG: hypothetical protein EOO38_24010 [Cytophagaceae bacterium]|nr:MAG: hypothetical protein EOO38_24010 [Cytophagaceae bacterium]
MARDLHKFVIGPMLKEGWRGTIGMIRWSELRKRLLEHPQAPDPKSPRKVIQHWLNRARSGQREKGREKNYMNTISGVDYLFA